MHDVRETPGFSGRAIVAAVVIVLTGLAVAAVGLTASLTSVRHGDRLASETLMVQAAPADYRPVAPLSQPLVPQHIGRWTPQLGVRIADRALAWLGWPYSWAAGDAAGPTYGTAIDAASRNDGHVRGFDCSGLTLYALAPWLTLDHDAATQYRQVGSFHPTLDSLAPGDLVFWSKDGTIGGIGHVAIYIGDGQVVQAPHSGARIQVTPIEQVEPGDMGATRPLT